MEVSRVVALCIVLTILTFLTLDYFVERAKGVKSSVAAAESRAPSVAPDRSVVSPLRSKLEDSRPAGFFLAPGHVWAELTSEGTLWLGLDRLAAGLLGAPDEIAIVPPGARVLRGAPIATVRRGARTLAMRAPFDGTVKEVNAAAARCPSLLFDEPYGAGRVCRFEPDDLEASVRAMRAGVRAREWMRGEVGRLRELLAGAAASARLQSVGGTLADGGAPIEGVADTLDAGAWTRIAAAIEETPLPVSGDLPS
jgi:glycine cleavage system H lipoate-binding protein